VDVLHHDHLTPRPPVQLVKERGEQLLTRAPVGQQGRQPPTNLTPDVVQRTKRPGREQRIARPEQETRVPRMPLPEPLDQRRLADTGLTRDRDDVADRLGRSQYAAQLTQQRRALEKIRHDATLRPAGLQATER
jgi:hypothetical protein